MYGDPSRKNLGRNKELSPSNIRVKEGLEEGGGSTMLVSDATDGIEHKLPPKYEARTKNVPRSKAPGT